jgi:hypothetical protein
MNKRAMRHARRMWGHGASEEVWSGSRFVGRIEFAVLRTVLLLGTWLRCLKDGIVDWGRSREAFLFRSRLPATSRTIIMNLNNDHILVYSLGIVDDRHASRGLVCVSHITSCIICQVMLLH